MTRSQGNVRKYALDRFIVAMIALEPNDIIGEVCGIDRAAGGVHGRSLLGQRYRSTATHASRRAGDQCDTTGKRKLAHGRTAGK